MSAKVIYEVECRLDPDNVADYDAWLPNHVCEVLACAASWAPVSRRPSRVRAQAGGAALEGEHLR